MRRPSGVDQGDQVRRLEEMDEVMSDVKGT